MGRGRRGADAAVDGEAGRRAPELQVEQDHVGLRSRGLDRFLRRADLGVAAD